MLAKSEDPAALDRRSFVGGDWLIEPKLDGIRAVATIVGGGTIALMLFIALAAGTSFWLFATRERRVATGAAGARR